MTEPLPARMWQTVRQTCKPSAPPECRYPFCVCMKEGEAYIASMARRDKSPNAVRVVPSPSGPSSGK